jgi:hypothetical protein
MRKRVLAGLLVLPSIIAAAPARKLDGTYVATAYAITGITASGEWTHRHVVAADPDILPLAHGSRSGAPGVIRANT